MTRDDIIRYLTTVARFQAIDGPSMTSDSANAAAEMLARDDRTITLLRLFAQRIMEAWPLGDIDGGELQDIAEQCGMLEHTVRTSSCGKNCACAESIDPEDFATGIDCYRRTALLTGEDKP